VIREFPLPSKEVLLKTAEEKLMNLHIDDPKTLEEIKSALNGARTFRDVNRIVMQKYIEWLTKKYR
jgi:hypothetical protein